MSPKPLLSLCCSTYSRPDLFRESLRGLLSQTYEPLEIVVLVDGGNPSSIDVLTEQSDPRLRWFATEKPSGMIPAWNRVVRKSKGAYFLYCADDDVLLPSAVEAQMDLLERNQQVGFCHADFYLIDDDGKRIGEWQSHEGEWTKDGLTEWQRYLRQPRCCMQTTVVRRDLWDRVGGWDEQAGYPGDNSLYLKLLRISDVGHVSRFACNYRIRTQTPDSWVKNSNKVKEDIILARQHLADPPAEFAHKVSVLHKQVNQHFSRNALSVLADRRAKPEERAEFLNWLKNNLLESPGVSWLVSALISLRLERLMSAWVSFGFWMRGAARRLAALARKSHSKE